MVAGEPLRMTFLLKFLFNTIQFLHLVFDILSTFNKIITIQDKIIQAILFQGLIFQYLPTLSISSLLLCYYQDSQEILLGL